MTLCKKTLVVFTFPGKAVAPVAPLSPLCVADGAANEDGTEQQSLHAKLRRTVNLAACAVHTNSKSNCHFGAVISAAASCRPGRPNKQGSAKLPWEESSRGRKDGAADESRGACEMPQGWVAFVNVPPPMGKLSWGRCRITAHPKRSPSLTMQPYGFR